MALEVPYVEPEIPDDLVDEAIDHLRQMAASLSPVEYAQADGSTQSVEVAVKAVYERVPADANDELARATSEFETLEELRADIEATLRDQLAERSETDFRSATVDKLA